MATIAAPQIRLEPYQELHVTVWGQGEPVLFVHGGFTNGEEDWKAQRPLADRYRVQLVDRCGHGKSPDLPGRYTLEAQAQDVAQLLSAPSHIVGVSYGAVVSLLAAALNSRYVRSLTLIEPPAFGLVRGHSDVETLIERLTGVWDQASTTTPEASFAAFLARLGIPRVESLNSNGRHDIEASLREQPPWVARIPLDALAQTKLPVLVVSGGWPMAAVRPGMASAWRAMKAVCNEIAARLNAEHQVFSSAYHNVQVLGKPFNDRLETFWAEAD
jgi:pimeloyl-ACP methyl ester carboxylesterase